MEDQDHYQRSAKTKRLRTRLAITQAARKLFAQNGWYGTRLEDVAQEAGVSVATIRNHFKTKQALIGHIFSQLVEMMDEDATHMIDDCVDPGECVEWFVGRLSTSARKQRPNTVAFLAAVQEQTIKTDGPPVEEDDVRALAPLPRPLIKIIAYGQQTGAFKPEPSAADVGAYHTNALLLRVLTRPDESAEETASIVLSQLLPALTASPVLHEPGAGPQDRG